MKPMLAAKLEDVGALKFPLLASPKLDGVRALVINGVVMSRSLKPIPNKHVQKLFGRPEFEGFDGELCVGPAHAKDLMQKTMSGVMSTDGEPDVTYWVFDLWNDEATFQSRDSILEDLHFDACFELGVPYEDTNHPDGGILCHVPQIVVEDQTGMDAFEADCLAIGYEGIMLRAPDGGYKQGRCGKKQPWLVKVKRFEDAEAVVVGVVERMHNDNEATTNELGRTKRSTHQENKRPAGDLGALICKTPEGIQFQIGTGFTAEQREELWLWKSTQDATGYTTERSPVGRIAKYKHFANAGVKDAPRFPVFLGFRDERDL